MNIITDFLKTYLSIELTVVIIAMLPLIELRGSIPVALAFGIPFNKALIISFLGSSIPAVLIIFFIDYIFKIFRKIKVIDKLITKFEIKTLSKKSTIEKYGYWGLMIFVAIPLPGTGVWSGAFLSYLLKMKKIKSIVMVLTGNLIAGIIVGMVSGGLFFFIK